MSATVIAPRAEVSEPDTGRLVVLVWDAASSDDALRIARQAVFRYVVSGTRVSDDPFGTARDAAGRLARYAPHDARGAVAYVA